MLKSVKSLIIVFNKIDLIKNKSEFKKDIILKIKSNIHQLKNIKIFFISSFSKKQILKIIDYTYENILSKNINLNTGLT